MINYQNGKVYKIINENNEIVYIGSTTQELLCDRYKTHKHKAPNHKIILIENYPCNSRQELCMREQQVIEEHDNLLNKIKAYLREEEKTKENKKEYMKEYVKNNKKQIQDYRKEYRKNNKKKIQDYTKQYIKNNIDKIKEQQKIYQKEYRKNNVDKIKEYKKNISEEKKKEYYQKVKIKCDFCNCEITKANLKRHQQSKKCLKIQNDLKNKN